MKRQRHILIVGMVGVLLLSLLTMTGCTKADASDRETIRVFSQLLPENALFYSEDGGVWSLDHRIRRSEGEAERIAAQRLGPVFLPETEDVGETLRLHITGIRKTTAPASSVQPDWWYLDYTYEKADNKPKTITLSLQIRLDGEWYLLPSGGLTPENSPDQPDSINLMKGRLYPEETEQIIPGHYRLLLFRDWRGAVSLDVEEFDLTETEEGFAIDHIQRPAALYPEEAYVPGRKILREDGSGWSLVEAGSLHLWDYESFVTDTLEAQEP